MAAALPLLATLVVLAVCVLPDTNHDLRPPAGATIPSAPTPATSTPPEPSQPGNVTGRAQPDTPAVAPASIPPDIGYASPVGNSIGAAGLRPITWFKARFDGHPDHLSPEDLAKAKGIISRYLVNFARISELAVHHERHTMTLVDNDLTRQYMAVRQSVCFFSHDIKAARSPLFFSMIGQAGDGRQVKEIVTPVGEISSGFFGATASAVPVYLDGEGHFSEMLLKYADSVRKDVRMAYDLPGLEEFTTKTAEATYDVIMNERYEPSTEREYWFNRQTGRLDYVVGLAKGGPQDGRSLREAIAFQYQQAGDIYYPRRSVWLTRDLQIRIEDSFSRLIVNGTASALE